MPITPERRPSNINERGEEFEVPKDLEDTGIKAVETAFKARVKDGRKNLTQSPATTQVTIKIPKTKAVLQDQAKGDLKDASTGFAMFWLRMIKKAIHFGKRIIVGGKEE